ncbi:MAG: hypothetical protein ACYDA9_18585 [Terriglobia bacterium]
MKVTRQEFLPGAEEGKATISDLLCYSLSLPVTTDVVGMPWLEMLKQYIELARNFTPLGDADAERIRRLLGPARERLQERLSGHVDGLDEITGVISE